MYSTVKYKDDKGELRKEKLEWKIRRDIAPYSWDLMQI